MMNKKAIAILGAIFILIVGTLGFLIYSKTSSSKKAAVPPVSVDNSNTAGSPAGNNQLGSGANNNASITPPSNPNPAPTPSQPTTQFTKLINDQVISPALFYNGKGVTYFNAAGQLYQATFQTNGGQLQIGDQQTLDIEARSNISKILWPAQGDNYLAQFDSGSQRTWSYYNSNTRGYTDLPSQVEAIDWLPTGDKVIYVWLDKNKATLNMGDPDTTNWKYIADMWEADDQIDISPDGRNILYYEQNTSSSTNPINLATPDGKIWKTLVRSGFNSGVLWSPDSQKFLFGKRDSAGKMQLWYYNILTDEMKSLNLYTIPEKAVWDKDSQTIYLAVPNSGVPGGDNLTVDTFYKLDTASMNKQQYDPGSTSIDGRNLFLSNVGDKLFFKNAQDGGLYYLDLTQ